MDTSIERVLLLFFFFLASKQEVALQFLAAVSHEMVYQKCWILAQLYQYRLQP
jgi:hypothetical protein